jgi:putative peptide zinc metalloprotease protein
VRKPAPSLPPETAPPPKAEPTVTGAELALRSDLIIEEVEEEGAVFYVIKDPLTQRFFRVKPLEHFLITQFDGKTSFDEIRRLASEQHQVLIGPDVLTKFTEKFVELGLLVRPGQEFRPAPDSSRQAGWLSRVLFLKIPMVNPEHLLDWLYPKVKWAFTPSFVALVTLSIVFAAGLVVVNRESLVFGLSSIATVEGALLIYITLSVVTVFHELAHGVTCRHFGGRVQDMGFLLLYFLPSFYCNVSDTYLFKAKRQRIWVAFAGGFFELFIWALAVLAWRVVAPEAFLSRVFFVVIAVCGIKSIFNFNPLIKLDGYFMLADYLGVANLRKEALSGLGRFMRRRLMRLDIESPRPELTGRSILSMRGDQFVTLFGAAALVYTVVLLGAILFWSGGWVLDEFGPNGLGLFTIAMLGLLHKPAATAVSSARSAGKEKWEQLGGKKRRFRAVTIWVVVLLAIALFPWQLRVRSDLTVLPQAREKVRAPADGRIDRIYFEEGQRVQEGALLLEYDTKALRLEKETQEAELAQAKEELRLLGKLNPTWQEEIRVQERALETARTRETAAQQEFERVQQLWSAGLLAREKFDEAQSVLNQAKSERRRQEANLQLVRKSSRTSRTEEMERIHLRDPDAQQAVIQRLDAELARLEDLLGRSQIHAPISGTLTTYRFQEKLGEFLEEGDLVCEVVNDEKVVIEMPVPEKEIDAVQVGFPVKFKVRGYPHRSFEAEVAEIAPVATRDQQISTILIRATIDNADHTLKPGMTGVAKVYCGRTIVSHVLLRDLIRFIRTEFWL